MEIKRSEYNSRLKKDKLYKEVNLTLTLCVVISRLHNSQKQSLLSASSSMLIVDTSLIWKRYKLIPHNFSPHDLLPTFCTRLRVTWHVNGNFHNNLVTKQSCFSTVVFKSMEYCWYVGAKCVVWQTRLCEPETEISLPGVEEVRRNSFTPWSELMPC